MLARTHKTLELITILSHEISTIINSYDFPNHRVQHFMMLDGFRDRLEYYHDEFNDTINTLTEGKEEKIAKTEKKLIKLAQSFQNFIKDRKKILEWATSSQEDVMTYYKYTTHTGYRGHTYKTYDQVTFVYHKSSGEEIEYNLHGMRSYWGRSSLADAISKKILHNSELKLNKLAKTLKDDVDKLVESERINRTKLQMEIKERTENERERRKILKTELILKNTEAENLRKLSLFKDKELQQVQKKLVEVDTELQNSVSMNSHLKVENHELKVQVTRSSRLRGR